MRAIHSGIRIFRNCGLAAKAEPTEQAGEVYYLFPTKSGLRFSTKALTAS
jgi:hypothetical protein